MDAHTFHRVALPSATLAFLFLAMVLPTLRLRRRGGGSAFVLHQRVNPFQRLIGVAMGVFVLGMTAWSALYAATGGAGLGLWAVPQAVRWAGWTLVAAGLGVVLVAQVQMGASWRIGIDREPTALVTRGLFTVVRNPIFAGMLWVVTGVALVTPGAWTVMAWVDYVLLVSLQVRLEEAHLLRLHGEDYAAYASRVGRFWPGVGRLSPTSHAQEGMAPRVTP
ncbi:isoprenylcysteine carboxylmethyltransferase family protein [Myxococcus sp. K15C18031901]|uniref:methyltransferase family protein n=1 Tax=Myxococcus dinghuensis TaxID=2906761 RepID=UPI0020A70F3F|nr:isoprenylcysteine carboxylmethyltransferase family protein [Myxococcus dinghuensis]MCP3102246.1 isoprenylcysteine carboxylmethyltransferase family protein [Myxococcus dinghuensis]